MVDGNLAEGLAAMEVDDGNLMDALMKTVAQGRPGRVEWSGMEVTTVTKPSRAFRRAKVTKEPAKLKVTKVKVEGGGEQYAFL